MLLRRGFATQQRAAARPVPGGGGAPKSGAKPASAKASAGAAASAAAAAAKLKAKAGAKAKQEPVIQVEKKPHYRVRDVFPARPLTFCKNASFKDIMKQFREVERKMGDEFQPSQSVLEVVLKKAETKAQLRRTVKLYMRTVLEHPLQKNQRPRQRLADLLFKRFLDLGDNRFAMHLLREPEFRLWPSPRLLQSAVHRWTHTQDGKARNPKAVAAVWGLYHEKADLVATPAMLSAGLRALVAPGAAALPSAMRLLARHAKALTADHYIIVYRAAIAAKDVPALLTTLGLREAHMGDSLVRQNAGLVKVELAARLATGVDDQLAAAAAQFAALSDELRARVLRGLLVDAALTPGLGARLVAMWQASPAAASPSDALRPLAELLAKLDASPDALRTSPLLQPLFARIEANAAKRAAKKPAAAAPAAEKPAEATA